MPKTKKASKYSVITRVVNKYHHVTELVLAHKSPVGTIDIESGDHLDDLVIKHHLAYNAINDGKGTYVKIDTKKQSHLKNPEKFVSGAFSKSGRGKNEEGKSLMDIRIRENNIFNTISTGKGGEFQSSLNVIRHGDRLRYLTINESEQIMGWPKDWTKFGMDEQGNVYEHTETDRYEMTGNGICSKVPKAIFDEHLPKDQKYKVLSTFSGADGSCLALDPEHFEIVGFCEYAKSQSDLLRYRHSNIKNFGDVTGEDIEKNAPAHDIFFTSPPCQSFSIAGKKKGLGDDRGQLLIRTLHLIEVHKPKYVLFENVKNLAHIDKGAVLDFILEEFNRIGYDVKINIVDASKVGEFQARERTFILATRRD